MADVEDAEQAEELEEAAEAISKEERRGSLKLWFGVLGSPAAWTGHLLIGYSLEEWFACARANEEKGDILGISVHTVSILVNTLMLVIAVASAVTAWSCWRQLRQRRDGGGGDGAVDRHERARWMAFAGVVEGALFIGIILLGYLPALMLGTCESSP